MPEETYQPAKIAAPAATGGAGPQFEAKVGAFYILPLLSGGEPRGLPGATVRSVAFQQRVADHPLDDVVVKAVNRDGSPATLEIQVKRSLTFTASDTEFQDVVGQIWKAALKPDFATSRYELAAAIAQTTTRIEHACQEALHWARQLPDGATFAAHINRPSFASAAMRSFVDVFRANLALVGAPTDDETVWRLLCRFKILVFDFESIGSDYDHRAREHLRWTLAPDQTDRANDLWPILIDLVGASARAAGAMDRATVVTTLEQQHGVRFTAHPYVRPVYERLTEAAEQALDEIDETVGGVRLARNQLIDEADNLLHQHRVMLIQGRPGVGKSAIMKHLATRLQAEGCVLALRRGRIISGGWLAMAHTIGWAGSQAELFNELGAGGGATLFIDNIDQIDDPGEWATVTDLLSQATRSQGWRIVATCGVESDDWKTKLPARVRTAGIGSLVVAALSDVEKAELSSQNQALALILADGHPAKGIAENLFYLSRLVELGVGQDAGIATELDLARLWWRYGGGRSEDDQRFARLKLLRAIGAQVISNPSQATFNVDNLESATLVELLRLESLREEIRGASVTFRHDVLRDWTIGFQLYEDANLLAAQRMERPLPAVLARGLEIAARLALADDPTGQRWLALLAIAERKGCHGSWKRPILLALPRSEDSLTFYVVLTPVLLESGGRRLREIIRLMIAVESEPLAALIARVRPDIALPVAGGGDFIAPKGPSWVPLVVWLTISAKSLPTELIPEVVKVFQAWLMTTHGHNHPLNAQIVGVLFDWLALVESHVTHRVYRDISEVPPSLNIDHLDDVRSDIRMIVFTFANLNPAAAAQYLTAIDSESIRHHDQQTVLKSPGTLPEAAPGPFADFALASLIEKDDPDRYYSRRRDYGPFQSHEHVFLDTSPDGGPLLSVLNASREDGLRLVRGLVEHATQWRREQSQEQRRPFPQITVPFPSHAKRFEGDLTVYRWARNSAPSLIATTALRALEAWGHLQIAAGRPFTDILDDILGPDGSSVAFLSVAVDLALSHWRAAADAAWPLAANPRLLQLDEDRFQHDVSGVNRLSRRGRQQVQAAIRVDIDAQSSRWTRLADMIGRYVFRKDATCLRLLRASLEQSRDDLNDLAEDHPNRIEELHLTVARALRMTEAENWETVTRTSQDGTPMETYQFSDPPDEQREREAQAARANANLQRMTIRHRIQKALLEPDQSTPALLQEALAWAKAQPWEAGPIPDDEDEGSGDQNKSYDAERNRRAVVMTAALVARDYESADRNDALAWGTPILRTASEQKIREYQGDQIEYNTTAIATLGIVSLFLRGDPSTTQSMILRAAAYEHPAAQEALGQNLLRLGEVDERLPRSIARIVMVSAVHPRRVLGLEKQKENERLYRETIDAAIDIEQRWLDGEGAEPSWPELATWRSAPRRGIRLGDHGHIEDDEDDDEPPSHYVDEHAIGRLTQHLIRFTISDVPIWVRGLAGHLMAWTDEANGPHGEGVRERDNRPHTWNIDFFDFAGVLSVALPHSEVTDLFLSRIVKFNDEAFHDAMASFLRGYDRATVATDTKNPENPSAVRALLADRIKRTWNYRRLGRDKEFTSETHAGDALNAMFYQPSRWANTGRPTIPNNWPGLQTSIAMLTELVVGAPTSGYLASLFLNLVESSHDKALVPFVAQAMASWCSAYGVDRNFWAEKNIGSRVCTWFDAVLTNDATALAAFTDRVDELFRCLDILVQSGVAQARILEEKIANSEDGSKGC
ncbi:hypothetical protein JQ554_15425 [Bradyrhizobium diazoefficiens]|nr:ATP-binding protein [Bradyrhizobium diazoefficiens]MBR0965683.1 hypothetical protein [Bradyrhizobium diazoefficiens]MBR0979375.1 hypothetical protein [Bradyrhizobium diazoefficiens]MBR1008567.1 hypothetical protein [Bradyrhizobium diazoefficiens]MBR1014684.1 hypothetical protein [Bradyrhizobium diazoefficiens]MBR1052528.1 hypothetical protein [Bradyrhizobium diazoefficiens]